MNVPHHLDSWLVPPDAFLVGQDKAHPLSAEPHRLTPSELAESQDRAIREEFLRELEKFAGWSKELGRTVRPPSFEEFEARLRREWEQARKRAIQAEQNAAAETTRRAALSPLDRLGEGLPSWENLETYVVDSRQRNDHHRAAKPVGFTAYSPLQTPEERKHQQSKILWRSIFYSTATALRYRQVSADIAELQTFCIISARRFVKQCRLVLIHEHTLQSIARSVAASLAASHDESKLRPPAKLGRTSRRQRDLDIVNSVLSRQAGARPSVRQLAAEFDISKTAAQRILARADVAPRHDAEFKKLSDAAQRLGRLCRELLPREGRFFAFASDVARMIDVLEGSLKSIVEELDAARLGFHMASNDSYLWVSKGRQIDKLWMSNVSKFDRRALRIPLCRHDSAVHTDLYSVLMIRNGFDDDRISRRFLEATFHEVDLTDLQRTWSFAVERSSSLEKVAERLWESASRRPRNASALERLSTYLQGVSRYENELAHEVIEVWSQIWGYEQTLLEGKKIGRSHGQFVQILSDLPPTLTYIDLLSEWAMRWE